MTGDDNGVLSNFKTGEREALLLRLQILELESTKDKRVPFWLPWAIGGAGTTLATLSVTLPHGTAQLVVAALSAGIASISSAIALATRGTK